MAFYSGKRGYVGLGTTSVARYKFKTWSLSMDGDDPDVSNFESGECVENIDGMNDATIELDGPYDVGGMPLTRGGVYTFHLGISSGIEFVVTARVKTIVPKNDARGKPELRVTAKTTGPFTPAIT